MKKILITGADSYIGTSFEEWLGQERFRGQYQVDTWDMRTSDWKGYDMSGYDSVFHVAGIAHSDIGRASEETIQMYYEVNSALALETAQKAKTAGVMQFILMSSMIVYGGMEHITEDTVPRPANFYGDSKWQADQAVRGIEDDSFRVVVLRPPMIYGKGSRGNYPLLAKLAAKLPIFPDVKNKRSVLYIDSLCEFVRLMIQNEERGIFFPQNDQLVATGRLVKQIAAEHSHKIWVTRLLAPLASSGKHMPGRIGSLCRKAFGNSYYEIKMSRYKDNYHTCSFEQSIKNTEQKQQIDNR